MYKQKLVITDLDGTLLDSRKALPEGCIKAFSDLAELDVKTAMITARPKRAAEDFVKAVGCDAAAYDNGAYIYRCGELISTSVLDGDFVRELTAKLTAEDPDVYIAAESEGQMYANYNMLAHWEKVEAERCDFPKFPFYSASKLIIGTEDKARLAMIASMINYGDVHVELAHSTVLITTDKSTKLYAAKKIAESFGIDMSDVYAFGDDIGDVELLRSVGHPYCVENGHPMAKASAKVIPANDAHGVISAIKKDILGT